MKNLIFLLAGLLAISCVESEDPQTMNEDNEQEVLTVMVGEQAVLVNQGLSLTVSKATGYQANNNVIISQNLMDSDTLDFSNYSDRDAYMHYSEDIINVEGESSYGFVLDPGKYSVMVSYGGKKRSDSGSLLPERVFYTLREFEVAEDQRVDLAIDFSFIDAIENPPAINYVEWPE